MTPLKHFSHRTFGDLSHGTQRDDRRLYDVLPFGALLVDDEGRILRHNPLDWMPGHPRHQDLFGVDFFRELCAGTPLEMWREAFREGVRSGELYRLLTLSFLLETGPREVTFLLYYHQQNGEAWIFIEPRTLPASTIAATRTAA